jgi:hypothetical protein
MEKTLKQNKQTSFPARLLLHSLTLSLLLSTPKVV